MAGKIEALPLTRPWVVLHGSPMGLGCPGGPQVTYNFAMYGVLLNKKQDDELARQAGTYMGTIWAEVSSLCGCGYRDA